jgi:hypothetical protein
MCGEKGEWEIVREKRENRVDVKQNTGVAPSARLSTLR